eukprot:gene13684-biopygen23066
MRSRAHALEPSLRATSLHPAGPNPERRGGEQQWHKAIGGCSGCSLIQDTSPKRRERAALWAPPEAVLSQHSAAVRSRPFVVSWKWLSDVRIGRVTVHGNAQQTRQPAMKSPNNAAKYARLRRNCMALLTECIICREARRATKTHRSV